MDEVTEDEVLNVPAPVNNHDDNDDNDKSNANVCSMCVVVG
jgi:hypothetical protein